MSYLPYQMIFVGKKKHTPSVSSLRESSHVKSGEDTVLSSELIHRRQVRVVRGVDFRITELESALSLFAGWPLVPGQVLPLWSLSEK